MTRGGPIRGAIPYHSRFRFPLEKAVVRGPMLLAAMLAVGAAQAGDAKFSLSSGLDYSVGDYGEDQETETWYLPLNLKYQSGRYTFKLGTGYVWMKGPLSVTPEGDPLPDGGVRRMVHGPGDVTASLAANVLSEDTGILDVDLLGKVKFGTADVDKALGTGKTDYALQVSLYKTVGSWGPYLDLGYRWKGDPAGVDYRNVWSATAGASYRISKAWSFGADYGWRDRLTATSSPVSEATFYANHKLSEHNRVSAYALAGFSDTSPDWGIGLFATHVF